MRLADPAPARLLLVERKRALRAALLTLFAEEGYPANGVSSLEEALAALERQSYALMVVDLYAGATRGTPSLLPLLRRGAWPTPLVLITAQASVLRQAQLEGFTGVVPKPIEVPVLLTEVAASLNYPLSVPQQCQAHRFERFLAAWSAQEWTSLLRACTEEITAYPSSLFPSPASRPVRGKLALLALVTSLRRRYQRLRLEAQGIFPRPHGLAVRYNGWFAERGPGWGYFAGVELVQFEGEQMCQIGMPMWNQEPSGLEGLLPGAFDHRSWQASW